MRLVVAFLLVATTQAVRAECPPTAVSSGDPVLVRSLSARLAASGIATASTEGCPVVHVRVEQRGDRVHLVMADAFSRTGQRQVQDVATAAAIVESWTRQEIEEGSLPDLAPPPSATTDVVAPAAAVSPRSTPSGIGLALETAAADDGSLWLGGSASACYAVGPVCVGGLVRVARDTRSTGDTADANHRSTEAHALATIDLPRRAGAFTISPGAGLGYGYLAVSASHLDAHMLPVEVTRSSHALRGDLHVTASRALTDRIAVIAELRGDLALARTAIPGGPRGFARASIGFRFTP